MSIAKKTWGWVAALAALMLCLCVGGYAYADDAASDLYPDEASISEELALYGSESNLDLGYQALSVSSGSEIIIAIDPGHGTDPETGSYDCGAVGYGFQEAVANQRIADACYAKINKYSGIKAIMVPQYRSVKKRVDWAVEQGASLYVSIHNNSSGKGDGSSVNGCCVFIPNDSSYNASCHETGDAVATRIEANLSAIGLNNLGTRTRDCTTDETYSDGHLADYYSANYEARQFNVCGIIIEHAFMDNASDNAKLQDAAFCKSAGEADAQAILEYYGRAGVDPDSCADYVEQLYNCALNRASDDGKQGYVDYLMAGGSAIQVAYNFFTSPEFEGLSLSAEDQISRVYRAMLGRYADSDGLAHWKEYLDVDMSAGAVVLGVGGCEEFTSRMSSISVLAGTASDVAARDKSFSVTSYATRLYRLALGREPDVKGLNTQTGALLANAGASVISNNFFISEEFTNMNLTNEERVAHVYRVMLNREPDADGLKFWTEYLDSYMSITSVVAGFAEAPEFNSNCINWNVTPGKLKSTEPRDQNRNVTAFVARLYNLVLNRAPEASGLNAHTNALLLGSTAADIVTGFFASTEFAGRNLSNTEIATIAYNALLNRNPDEAGLNDWVARLDNGMPLSYLVAGFVDSTEFSDLCAQYGIQPGHISYDASEMAAYASGKYPIMGTSAVTASTLAAHFLSKGASYPSSVYTSKGASTIQEFCEILVNQANSEGVRAEVLYAQAMVETGYLKFGGDVDPDQCNFGGLGATGNGVKGNVFSSVSEGLLAQAQHLKCYASTDALNNACVDQRWSNSLRGTAPYVEDLSNKWAASAEYGKHLRSIISEVI